MPQVRSRLSLKILPVGIQASQQKRTQRRFEIAQPPEAADLRFFENVIASQDFIRTLACQHNLEAVFPHRLRQQEDGRRRYAPEAVLRAAPPAEDPDDISAGTGYSSILPDFFVSEERATIDRAGLPNTLALEGMSLITTLPAPTNAHAPIFVWGTIHV
jgi:hypothetical protein